MDAYGKHNYVCVYVQEMKNKNLDLKMSLI